MNFENGSSLCKKGSRVERRAPRCQGSSGDRLRVVSLGGGEPSPLVSVIASKDQTGRADFPSRGGAGEGEGKTATSGEGMQSRAYTRRGAEGGARSSVATSTKEQEECHKKTKRRAETFCRERQRSATWKQHNRGAFVIAPPCCRIFVLCVGTNSLTVTILRCSLRNTCRYSDGMPVHDTSHVTCHMSQF